MQSLDPSVEYRSRLDEAGFRSAYGRHLVYAIFDSAAAGILANAPIMALKGMGSPPWQMSLQLAISSIGMFAVLYLGGAMAHRKKMPFIVAPGLAFAACSVAMAATSHVLAFLVLAGLGGLFDTASRPGVTAVLRQKYPASQRGAATGRIRALSSLVFLATTLASASLLDLVSAAPAGMIRGQLLVAGLLSIVAFVAFGTIREAPVHGPPHERSRPLADALRVVRHDVRFARYLGIGGLYALGAMVYVSFIPVLLSGKLGCGYLASSALLHVIPGVMAFASTGWIGRQIDRLNPWRAWSWIRLGWGLDPLILAATPVLATVSPAAALGLAAVARTSRGLVMGGSWILWWQVGVHHFAPPGGDTARYQAVVLFVNGFARLAGPLAGAWLLHAGSIEAVLVAGGVLVLVSAGLSSRESRREKLDDRYATIARFEAQFEPPGAKTSDGRAS